MKKLCLLWIFAVVITAISITYTYQWVISPIWIVNIIIGYGLIQLRHQMNHPIMSGLFGFSAIFCASWLFDPMKDVQTKVLLSLISGIQIVIFVQLYYWFKVKAQHIKYIQTLAVSLPNIISACVAGLLFMMIFDFGVNSYEFLDYFLEQFVTGVSVFCIFYGISHWKNIPLQAYGLLCLTWMIQYVISTDPIFYGCFIFPFLMCYFALNYKLKEFSLLVGVLTFVCSIYVSVPLAGEYWSKTETHMLSRLSSYRLALACYLIIFLFICEIYLNNRRLRFSYERMMFCDELTGLKNRRFVREKVLTDKAIKNGYVLLLDIDNFKKVNDVHGHYVGDLVIQHLTHILMKLSAKNKITVRWGGEEFLLIVAQKDIAHCRECCDEILQACLNTPFIYKDCQIDVTVSIGATTFDQFRLDNYAHWIHEADKCLYEAKAGGKKQYILKA